MKKIFDTVFKGKNGDFKVLKREKDNCKIVFLNTGFETSANIRYIKDGSILANKGLPSVCGVGIVGKELKLELAKEYNKKNCTWIKKTENGLFTSKTRAIKATKENLEIKANSIKEMARKLKMNEKTVAKYLNSEYLGWKLEEIKIKR